MPKQTIRKKTIGRAELLHFLDYQISDIPAKVDTGAYRSAVHASNIKLINDGKTLRFTLLGGHSIYKEFAVPITTDKYSEVWVENSFGHSQKRYEVKLRIKLGTKTVTTAFTLADRSKKIYPILLGRKLLNNRYVVDPSLCEINRAELKKKFKIDFPDDEEERGADYEDSDTIKRAR